MRSNKDIQFVVSDFRITDVHGHVIRDVLA